MLLKAWSFIKVFLLCQRPTHFLKLELVDVYNIAKDTMFSRQRLFEYHDKLVSQPARPLRQEKVDGSTTNHPETQLLYQSSFLYSHQKRWPLQILLILESHLA